jgi:hypothetical protein
VIASKELGLYETMLDKEFSSTSVSMNNLSGLLRDRSNYERAKVKGTNMSAFLSMEPLRESNKGSIVNISRNPGKVSRIFGKASHR